MELSDEDLMGFVLSIENSVKDAIEDLNWVQLHFLKDALDNLAIRAWRKEITLRGKDKTRDPIKIPEEISNKKMVEFWGEDEEEGTEKGEEE